MDVVGTTDNFFRLGGDSIVVIQLVSRARETGIQLKPAQIFEYPTIIELANVCELIETLKAEQGIVTGVSMLTPIQRHFFKQVTSDAGHYNQTEVISFSGEINARYLIETLDSLIVQHDVLRSSFNVEALQSHEISGWKEGQAEQLIIKIDGKPTYTFEMADVEREIIKFNTSFDLKNDNLVKVLWFDSKEKSYIAFIIHHLIIDGVSWRILLEDFEKCYMALANGSSINLPGKTTSYFDWSKVLLKASVENYWDDEISYWCGLQQQLVSKLPIPNDSKNTRDLSLYVEQELDRDTTDLLMTKAHYAFGTEVNDLLLSALLLSFRSCMEMEELLIDLEGHGREDLFLECDISRTVGWFTSIFPVLLADGGSGTVNKNVGSLVQHIKEMLRGVPRKGVGFGNLVYLGNENKYQELRQIKPDVRFNYFGKIDTQANKISKFHRQRLSVYANHSPNQVRPYALNINAAISDGVFRINFDYNREHFSSENIQLLAENYIAMLKDIVLYCCDCEFTTLTPSDVPEASLSQKELDDLIFELEYLNMEKTEESIV